MAARANPDETEHTLTGGNVAASVVRIGSTVRKPVTEATPDVEAFLRHLAAQGFEHAPRSLGRDPIGRQMLEFIPGETVTEPELLTLAELRQIAAVIRELHDVSATFAPAPGSKWNVLIPPANLDLICHNDLGAWNLVRSGSRWVFIDWDGSGPSSRLWDLAYAAQSIVLLAAHGNPQEDAVRLRAFVDGYGLDDEERSRFPQILRDRTRFGYDFLKARAAKGDEPWASMYAEGHGTYWRNAAKYIGRHRKVWVAALVR